MNQMKSDDESELEQEMKRLEIEKSSLKNFRGQQSAEVRREASEMVHPDKEHRHQNEDDVDALEAAAALERLNRKNLEIANDKGKEEDSCSSAEIRINVDRGQLGLPERNQSAQGSRISAERKLLKKDSKSLSKLLDEYADKGMMPIDEDLKKEDDVTPDKPAVELNEK